METMATGLAAMVEEFCYGSPKLVPTVLEALVRHQMTL